MEFKDDATVVKESIETFLKGKEEAEQLVNDGVDVDIKDSKSKSLIEYAIELGNTELVEFLLDQGAEIKVFDRAIQLANEKGHEELVLFLLQRFYSAERRDNSKVDQKTLDHCLLYFAERTTSYKIVDLILSFGATSNANDEAGISALQLACKVGNEDIFHLLIDKGANLDYKDPNSKTVLHFAAHSKNPNLVEWLLNKGFQVNEEDYSGANALWFAVEYSNAKVVEVLLRHGANVRPTICEDEEWISTILHKACSNNNEDEAIVKLILEAGVNINEYDEEDETPLDCAVDQEHEKIVELLLVSGAELRDSGNSLLRMAIRRQNENLVELCLHRSKVDNKNCFVERTLQLASAYENTTIFKLLLNQSNLLDKKCYLSVLKSAVENNRENMVKLILESGQDIDDIKQHKDLLLFASKNGYKSIVEALLKYGFDSNSKDNQGYSALYYAFLNKRMEIVTLLQNNGARIENEILQACVRSGALYNVQQVLEHEVDVNWRRNADELSTLELSVYKFELFQALWNRGGKLDAKGCHDKPLLNSACFSGNNKVVNFILDQGADISTTDENGITCLIAAVDGGSLETVNMLLKKGINVEIRDSFGRTALSAALLNFKRTYKYTNKYLYVRSDASNDDCKWMKLTEQLLDYGAHLDTGNQDDIKNVKFIGENRYLSKLQLLVTYNIDIKFIGELLKGLDNNSSYWRETLMIITKYYILKAHQSKGACIAEEALLEINKSGYLKEFKIQCEDEIKLMKESIVANSTISFYNILTSNNLNQLASYATTAEVQKAFSLKYKISSEYKAKFPIYHDMMRSQIKKGIWRKLLLNKLTNFFTAVAKAEGNEGLAKLPALCVAEIYSYLSNRDLQTLHRVCNVQLGVNVFDVSVNYEY